jgi:hypothetical protein
MHQPKEQHCNRIISLKQKKKIHPAKKNVISTLKSVEIAVLNNKPHAGQRQELQSIIKVFS